MDTWCFIDILFSFYLSWTYYYRFYSVLQLSNIIYYWYHRTNIINILRRMGFWHNYYKVIVNWLSWFGFYKNIKALWFLFGLFYWIYKWDWISWNAYIISLCVVYYRACLTCQIAISHSIIYRSLTLVLGTFSCIRNSSFQFWNRYSSLPVWLRIVFY